MEDIADHFALVFVGFQSADFEDELGLAVVEDGDLGVGGLALVFVAESSAQADGGFGVGGIGDSPAGFVHFVDALVADVAVAGVPEPVPVVVNEIAMEGLLGRGAQPDIEIDFGRRGFDRFEADAVAFFVAEGAAYEEFAELA